MSSSLWHFHVLECFIARTVNNRGRSLNMCAVERKEQKMCFSLVIDSADNNSLCVVLYYVAPDFIIKLLQYNLWLFLAHLSISFFCAWLSFVRFNYSVHVALFLSLNDLWIFFFTSQADFMSYLDAFLRVLNWTEKESAIDQRISIIHQHHFFAQDARHVSLLMSCERWQHKHSRIVVSVLSFVFNLE